MNKETIVRLVTCVFGILIVLFIVWDIGSAILSGSKSILLGSHIKIKKKYTYEEL